MDIAALYIFSYLVGSLPTAYLIAKLVKRVDLRRYGSGNVGASNFFSHVGKKWVVPLALFEVLIKGALPVWAGVYLLDLERSSGLLMVAPLLAVIGNNWSVFLRLQGGRGIAVASGTLLGLSPVILVPAFVVAVGGWAITRSSGIWVLIALAILPFLAVFRGDPLAVSLYCAGLLALVVLKRLISNWTPLPEDSPRRKVLVNRLLRDRDVDGRDQWVDRVPDSKPGAGSLSE